ncbi:MAG: terminase gpA endonuclease subunit [Bacteroidota bacterium]
MMDAFSDSRVEEVILFTSSGVGKTSLLENVLGYYIDYDPCPILFVEPTDGDAQRWSKDHLATTIRDTPCLAGRVYEAKGRRGDNTITHKKFPGGYLSVVGANSPRGFRRMTARVVLLDEVDGYPPTAGPEGDPLELARRRTRNLWNKKIGIVSTPTMKGFSRIETAWLNSDQRHYFVPCPRCRTYQILIFGPSSQFASLSKGYLRIDQENPARSCYICEHCGKELRESDKFKMIARGEWRATNSTVRSMTGSIIAGFHLSELYSTFSSWESIARKWLVMKKHRESLRVYINTILGETWEEPDALTTTAEALEARKEKYAGCPAGVILLTAAVDIQVDRLECVVKGWGLNDESWLIDVKRFYFATPGGKEAWQLLDDYLKNRFPVMDTNGRETGVTLPIVRTFVDSGYRATDVYAWTAPRRARGIFAIKGVAGERDPLIGKISRTQAARKGAILIPIGVHIGKRMVYDRLDIKEPGPGYVHLNEEATEDYLKQLTSEKLIPHYTRDRIPVLRWVRKVEGGRNEALDLEVYNLAAFTFINANMTVLAKRLEARVSAAPEKAKQSPARGQEETGPKLPATRRSVRRSSFVSGWRKW